MYYKYLTYQILPNGYLKLSNGEIVDIHSYAAQAIDYYAVIKTCGTCGMVWEFTGHVCSTTRIPVEITR